MAARVKNGNQTAGRRAAAGALLLGALLLLAAAPTAQANLVGLWRLDTSNAGLTPNDAIGGAPGSLNGSAAIVAGDVPRGTVLDNPGGGGDFTRGGNILPLSPATDDFTWVFWAKQNNAQAINNDVILGNRFGGQDNDWVKFTPNAFEYRDDGTPNLDYANVPSDDTWYHHAVVKSGNSLQYYRNGSPAGSVTTTTTMDGVPFFMGGDSGGEQWQGRLDDVALFSRALSQAEVQQAQAGNFAALRRPVGYLAVNDTFPGPSVDTDNWNVIEKGLESQGGGTAGSIAAAINGSGQLVISGTANTNYWGGRTLQSVPSFNSDLMTTFAVDRVSLAGSGSAYRSSIWLWGDDQHYLHFSQNVNETGWQYNWNDQGGLGGVPTGSGVNIGVLDPLDGDTGAHGMKLVYLPTGNTAATIEMYFDGQLVASQNFTNWTPGRFFALITGQARASGDTVEAIFDNAEVLVMPEPCTLSLLALGGAAAWTRRRRRRS
jgi:hypothetical protein